MMTATGCGAVRVGLLVEDFLLKRVRCSNPFSTEISAGAASTTAPGKRRQRES
jgi:hypothetical protein